MMRINKIRYIVIWILMVACVSAGVMAWSRYNRNKTYGNYTLKTFRTGAGWGYSVLKNERIIIYQPHIPGASGNCSFAEEEEALNTGLIVLTKLKNKEYPVITTEELSKVLMNEIQETEK